MKFTGGIVFVVALLISLVSGPSLAETKRAQHYPLRVGSSNGLERLQHGMIRVQQKGISRDQAAALVKRKYGGKILAIKEVQRNGRAMYRVKGLSEKSQVYVVFVDKQSGQVSR